MEVRKNVVLQSAHGRPFLADVYWQPGDVPQPLVVFSHGFKGFKDWGAFHEVAGCFAAAGFIFVKFNFSHNGTTIDEPLEFTDLEAFGHNNFSIELDDLGVVIDWALSENFPAAAQVNTSRLYLIGHSRGGGITLLKAGEDTRVKKAVSWAGVNEFGKFWKENQMQAIKERGVIYVENGRTKQQMPLYWQLYENYFHNLERLYIPDVVRGLRIPVLAVHGTADDAVPYSVATELQSWNKMVQLFTIENGNHVFGMQHPWIEASLPLDLETVLRATIDFLNEAE